jgi:nucleoside phosphorylase
MGMSAAAVLAMKMIITFRPRYISMSGITAGIPGKTRLGDIIVADPSWDWGSGKWIFKDGKISFLQSPHQMSLDTAIRNKLRLFSADKITLAKIQSDWPGETPPNELVMHIGPLASGASVLSDGITIDQVKQQHRELLGVEMETYGIYVAADEAPSPKPSFFALKSVVDFANGEKNDKYQKYASYTSAQALRFFTENYLIEHGTIRDQS